MSHYFEAVVTLTILGDERDCGVRGFVSVEYGLGMGGSLGAELDGDADVRLGDDWWPLDSVDLGDGDVERIAEALENAALGDDSDQCKEWGDAAK